MNIKELEERARQTRKSILTTVANAGSGHIGGSLSCVEILISLYSRVLKYDPKNPSLNDRDRLIVSKGHVSPAVYSILSMHGYFPEEELKTYRKINSRLQGHVFNGVPGVEFSTGSLGQGLSYTNGIALGAKLLNAGFKTYCLLGDGEIQEGQIWEAAMTAAQYKLDNLCAVIDYNKIQENDFVENIKNEEPVQKKWDSFGWNVLRVNGHDFNELFPAFDIFNKTRRKPTVIIADTIKGKGVSFMENKHQWHAKIMSKDESGKALAELE